MELIDEYATDSNRFILILSDRISQLEWFEKALNEWPTKFIHGYYIGGMKQTKLDDNADKCQILLATYQMASEAFSVKKLNTVILATPRKNVEQSTGRIFRQRIDERKVALISLILLIHTNVISVVGLFVRSFIRNVNIHFSILINLTELFRKQ